MLGVSRPRYGLLGVLLPAMLAACGDDVGKAPSDAGGSPEGGAEACAAGQVALDAGGCRPAGVPSDGCGPGFVHDGDVGCNPVLPTAACPDGLLALPGETTCHEVAPCGASRWGEAPIDATTEHVDAAYAGGASDGTEAKPWTTIQQGIDAAAPGAVVVVAAGTYLEDVVVEGKPVRLWGRCPGQVEIVGTALAALRVGLDAAGTEVHTLAVRGDAVGITVSGAKTALVDRVWVHDTAYPGARADNALGSATITVRASLIERAHGEGLYLSGADATIEATVIRRTVGQGVLAVTGGPSGVRSSLALSGSIVETSAGTAVSIKGSDASIEASVVRDNQPNSAKKFGRGVSAQDDPSSGQRATLSVARCVVERNYDVGIGALGTDLAVEATSVRDTYPSALDGTDGRGIAVEAPLDTQAASVAAISATLVERSNEIGVAVLSSALQLDATVVRDTKARASDGIFGVGLYVGDVAGTASSSVDVRSCVIERSVSAGMLVRGSSATLDRTLIRSTAATAVGGDLGDGLAVIASSGDNPTTAGVTGSHIEGSARAGISNFGAIVTLGTTGLECNPIALDGEFYQMADYQFVDQKGNVCGCDGSTKGCAAVSSNLAAPPPLL